VKKDPPMDNTSNGQLIKNGVRFLNIFNPLIKCIQELAINDWVQDVKHYIRSDQCPKVRVEELSDLFKKITTLSQSA
jgi:hypothetical protein